MCAKGTGAREKDFGGGCCMRRPIVNASALLEASRVWAAIVLMGVPINVLEVGWNRTFGPVQAACVPSIQTRGRANGETSTWHMCTQLD